MNANLHARTSGSPKELARVADYKFEHGSTAGDRVEISQATMLEEEKENNYPRSSNDTRLIKKVRIAKLKRNLKVFKWVYDNDLPEPDYKNYEIAYNPTLSDLPRPVPKAGFKTQGHRPLRRGVLGEGNVALTNHINQSMPGTGLHRQSKPHSREVLTEDDSFGLSLYEANEVAIVANVKGGIAEGDGNREAYGDAKVVNTTGKQIALP